MSEISNILTRMRELGVQASSDTVGDTERGFLDKEVQQLKSEAQRITQTTKFGTTKLLDGSGDKFDFQVGIGNDSEADRNYFQRRRNGFNCGAPWVSMGLTLLLKLEHRML